MIMVMVRDMVGDLEVAMITVMVRDMVGDLEVAMITVMIRDMVVLEVDEEEMFRDMVVLEVDGEEVTIIKLTKNNHLNTFYHQHYL